MKELIESAIDFEKDVTVKTYEYGSIQQEIAIDTSDMDIAVLGFSCQNNKDLLVKLQNQIYSSILKLGNSIVYINNITTASVPVIKLKVKLDDQFMNVDIMICDKDDYMKLFRLQQAISFVKSSISEFKSLKPVILFIKKLLSLNNLLDTYSGGLNSYSVVIMAVCVANEMVSVNSPPTSAEYLKQFLLYYKSYETFRSYAITKNGRMERTPDDPSLFYI